MRIFLNISLVLLLFFLPFSLSCQSYEPFEEAGPAEPDDIEKLFGEVDQKPTAIGPGAAEFDSVEELIPGMTNLVAISEVSSSVVSRTYPWAECGLVQLDKAMPREVELNRPFDYYIKITNLTNTRLTDIVIKEELSTSFSFNSATPSATRDENRLVWKIDSLGPKASRLFKISGEASYFDSLKHCTTVLTPVIPACASVAVVQPRLQLTKIAPDEVLLCDLIPVKYVVTNTGTGLIQNVKIVETLPEGLRTTDGRSVLSFDADTLAAGQSRQFTIELRATKPGEYVSKAVASSSTSQSAESQATTTIVRLPVLTITKTGPDRQYIGRPVTYDIIVTNASDAPAKNTVVEDTVPGGVGSIKATSGAKLNGSKLVWEFGTVAPNTSQQVSVSYTPTKAGTLTSSVTATAYCADTVTASTSTLVTGIPAVLLEVVDVEDPVRLGNSATYVITVTNQGSATATNIRIACILEDNVKYISSAGTTASTIEGEMVKFLPLGNLAPKAKAAWRVVVEAVRPGDVRFKVIMNTDQLTRPVEEAESTLLYD